ncbi:MAG: nucleoside deaminase [Clostridia bacterium]|nr:nucleoside deaminase [Clostridia bacterium]
MNSRFMTRAIELAKKASAEGEVPVGAVVVKDGKIIGEGYNMREQKKNALSHAEIEAINAACKTLGDWRLDNCTIYVTLEPCPMCAGAIINARISEVVFGAYDLNMGCMDSVSNIAALPFAAETTVYGGIKEDECKKILTDFFEGVRK